PLMRKERQAGLWIGRSTAFDRAHAGARIDKIRIAGIVAEIVVVRQTLRVLRGAVRKELARRRRPSRGVVVRVGVMLNPSQRQRQLQPVQRLRKLLCPEQRAARRPGRHGCEGAAGERAQAVLQGDNAAGGEQAPLVKIAPGDLAKGQGLDDLGAVVSCILSFPLSHARSVFGYVHKLTLRLSRPDETPYARDGGGYPA